MTNNQTFELYNKWLASYCQCYADSEGNRPCDYGCLCDKCMTPQAQESWKNFKNHK